ncbi:PPC domain-containing protein [Pseudanabaena sp. lw0831]|uniref:PPC domain-containing protein n=1 Tax=Pseudanabaena sp. lw0831 TaxID=1357935 RepID=UPI001F2AE750|nr:PPC domain-containing protein [Pseudanabaena sp. lw0831]
MRSKAITKSLALVLLKFAAGVGAIAIGLATFAPLSLAQVRTSIYKPTAIASGVDVNDILTDKDIPTGQKGFARDYAINVQKDERLEISVSAGGFDTVLSLLDSAGEVVAENDDSVGDNTNSLIFFKVRQSGNYIVRVSSFGGSSGGKFTLRVNKLQVVK